MTKRKKTGKKDPELARQIYAYREKHGLTFRAFAQLAEISLTTAWRAEQGKVLGVFLRAHLRKLIGVADA